MFKKPFVVQTTAKVKGSELKKIKAKLLKSYELTEEELDTLLPKDVNKLQLDNKAFLYAGVDNVPIFIEEGRGNIVPSLFTLWANPKMAKTISIFAPVSPFVCKKGADVMLPGCAPENLGSFKPGDARALLVSDPDDATNCNPMPIAIGEMDVNSEDDHEMKGRAMRERLLDSSFPQFHSIPSILLHFHSAYSDFTQFPRHLSPRRAALLRRSGLGVENDEFCIKNDEFCIENDGFCIKNDGFCIKNDDCNGNGQRATIRKI